MIELRNRSDSVDIQNNNTTWWHRRTLLEKRLIIGVLFVSGIIFSFLIDSVLNWQTEPAKVCKTVQCLTASSDILNQIDEAVDPCDTFYEFACRRLTERTHEKDAPGEVMRYQVTKQLTNILSDPTNANDSSALNFERQMYTACMNEASNGRSLKVLKSILSDLGGWPVLMGDKWNADNFSWIYVIGKLRKLGLHHTMLLRVDLEKDRFEDIGNNISLKGTYLYFSVDKYAYAHKKLMTDHAIALGATEANAADEMNKAFEFIVKLKKIINFKGSKDEEEESRLHILELQDQCAEIDWLKYLEIVLEPVYEVTKQDYVVLPYSNFVIKFCNLMNATSPRTLANYMLWSAITKITPFVSNKLLELHNQFRCFRMSVIQDLEDGCLGAITDIMYPIPSYLAYVDKHVSESSRKEILNLFNSISRQLKQLINVSSWMDDESKSKSNKWLEKIIPIIGANPETINDVTKKMYKAMHGNDSFLGTYLKMREQQSLQQLLGNGTLRDIIHIQIPETRILFFKQENAIMLPTSMLQGMYFDENRPMYMNYGTLGKSIGSVLAYTYTDAAIKELWSDNLKQTFENKLSCIKHKSDYLNEESLMFFVKQFKFAQTLGTKLAYDAYKKWLDENDDELNLVGLNYTNLQIFWISTFADVCYEETYETAFNFYSDSETLRQNFDFAIDFRCDLDSKMNPKNKCIVLY